MIKISIKKGDLVVLNDGRTGIITKYSSNKEIHLNNGIICSKDEIKETSSTVVEAVNSVASIIKEVDAKKQEKGQILISPNGKKFTFKNKDGVEESVEDMEANGIFYVIRYKDRIESWLVSKIEEFDEKTGNILEGSGPQNWIKMSNILEKFKKGFIKTSEEFHNAIIEDEIKFIQFRTEKIRK